MNMQTIPVSKTTDISLLLHKKNLRQQPWTISVTQTLFSSHEPLIVHVFVCLFIHRSTSRNRNTISQEKYNLKRVKQPCPLNNQYRAVPVTCSQNVTQHSEYNFLKNLRRRCYCISQCHIVKHKWSIHRRRQCNVTFVKLLVSSYSKFRVTISVN